MYMHAKTTTLIVTCSCTVSLVHIKLVYKIFFVNYLLGAGGGIGRQLALKFAAHGAKLVLWDINKGNEQRRF